MRKVVAVQIEGTIIAPSDRKQFDLKTSTSWLLFHGLNDVSFGGGGIVDGQGYEWWAQSCKINKTNVCIQAPTALTIDSSTKVRVTNLKIQNSQQMHMAILESKVVRISGMLINSPHDSPNTDGIHIASSMDVVVENCTIGTGDDCISIASGTSDLKMKNIHCGPGHGISIGSLGKNKSVASVTGIVLNAATLSQTTNGLRIKCWQGGSGHVNGVTFSNVLMNKVANPIIIDQFYCDSDTACPNQTSAVKISQVLYRNISGTSVTENAIKLACSNTVPCDHIMMENIDLWRADGAGPAKAVCNSATGNIDGMVSPRPTCLQDDTSGRRKQEDDSSRCVHTEL